MVINKSSDPYIQIYIALLCDVQTTHSEVFTRSALRKTTQKVIKRYAEEGSGFLTKTLPRLAKALDRALTGDVPLDCTKLAFKSLPGSKLPQFCGELFQCVFAHDGWILPTPCVKCVKSLRQLLLVFYKLELPNDERQEQDVLEKFERTDRELASWNATFSRIRESFDADPRYVELSNPAYSKIIRSAKILLAKLFAGFDPRDIHPRHGPGAVSTKEQLAGKYTFRCVSPRIIASYPLDAYFYASLGHVCDELSSSNRGSANPEGSSLPRLTHRSQPRFPDDSRRTDSGMWPEFRESSARVLLVPKDSRGPRLISCEPLDFQWIQQGLGSALVRHLESHPLTRWSLHFSDQTPNQCGASLGSITGGYATLDLNEASDRVSTELVRLLFPEPLCSCLLNSRSLSTVLPDGRSLILNKYAPMGSALCFPVLATVCWALLAVGLPDAGVYPYNHDPRKTWNPGVREDFLVYGDDIIVKSAHAEHAMRLLESFGLKINRDKSCVSGFFRESCGRDAFKGVNVTPVRIRTVWSSHRCPDTYTSYIATANLMYKQNLKQCYDTIVQMLLEIYREIPEGDDNSSYPALVLVPEDHQPKTSRVNKALQKLEWLVWDIRLPRVTQTIGGWKMLLRFFAETSTDTPFEPWNVTNCEPRRCGVGIPFSQEKAPFSVSSYTKRKASCLVKRWR